MLRFRYLSKLDRTQDPSGPICGPTNMPSLTFASHNPDLEFFFQIFKSLAFSIHAFTKPNSSLNRTWYVGVE